MTEASNRRRKDSAKLVWDTKPKRAPNPRDIEFQTAEIVIPNPKTIAGELDVPLFAKPQAGVVLQNFKVTNELVSFVLPL